MTAKRTKVGNIAIAGKHTDENGAPPPTPATVAHQRQMMELKLAQEQIRARQMQAAGIQAAPAPAYEGNFPDLTQLPEFGGMADPAAPPPGTGEHLARVAAEQAMAQAGSNQRYGQPQQYQQAAQAPQYAPAAPAYQPPQYQQAPQPAPAFVQVPQYEIPVMSPQQVAAQQQPQAAPPQIYQPQAQPPVYLPGQAQPPQGNQGYPMVQPQQQAPAPQYNPALPPGLAAVAPAFQQPGIPAAVNPVPAPHDPNARLVSTQGYQMYQQPGTPVPPHTREQYNIQQQALSGNYPDAAEVFLGKTNEHVTGGWEHLLQRPAPPPPVQRVEHIVRHETPNQALAYECTEGFAGYIGDAMVEFKRGQIIYDVYIIDALMQGGCNKIVALEQAREFIGCPACKSRFPMEAALRG